MPTSTKDLYEILGVSRSATDDEIKRAFRRRARDLHPDVNKSANAEEEFKELNEAYDVLSDPGKRSQYDRFGTIPGAASAGGYVDFEDIFGGMGDIFSTFFGGGVRERPMNKEGRDMGIGLTITLAEAASGTSKEIVYDRLAPCTDCDGTGVGEDGTESTCPDCNGSGRVVTVQRTFLGDMQSATTCTRCHGFGKIIEGPCEECNGQGRVPDRQRVSVEIPAGIHDGQQLKISGFGEAGMQGNVSGDLIVTVRIEEDDFFKHEGVNLHASIKIPMTKAVLGTTEEVYGILPDEIVSIKIPAGSQEGDVIKVAGHGLPKLGTNNRGALFVHLDIQIPKRLSKRERKLMQDFAAMRGDSKDSGVQTFQRLDDLR